MILTAFTLFHVLINLVGIGSGITVVAGLLTSKRLDGWTATFVSTTAATSLTGFLFPFTHLTPGIILGILSLIVLTFAVIARYRYSMAGAWRRTYVITALSALYFNVFVLVAQMFQKIPSLHALAPTQTETPFKLAQLTVLVIFLLIGALATKNFHVLADENVR